MYPVPDRQELSIDNVDTLLGLSDKYACPELITTCCHYLRCSALPQLTLLSSSYPSKPTCHNPSKQSSTSGHANHVSGTSTVLNGHPTSSVDAVLRWLGAAKRHEDELLSEACCALLGRQIHCWSVMERLKNQSPPLEANHLLTVMANIPPMNGTGSEHHKHLPHREESAHIYQQQHPDSHISGLQMPSHHDTPLHAYHPLLSHASAFATLQPTPLNTAEGMTHSFGAYYPPSWP
jgi:hypothetical protein